MGTPISVRRAREEDVTYLTDLQRKHNEQIGFLPTLAVAGYCGVGPYAHKDRNHRAWLATVDGERVGFLLASPGVSGGSVKVVQICLQDDARRREYGTALVRTVEEWAASVQRAAVSCAVATDLDARQFWDALGYGVVGVTDGGVRRGRKLERRYRSLPVGLLVPNMAPTYAALGSASETTPHPSTTPLKPAPHPKEAA